MLVSTNAWLNRLWASLKTRGLWRSMQVVICMCGDFWSDLRYGIDTGGEVQLSTLKFESEYKARGVKYLGTRVRSFRKLMANLDLPPASTLVDFGCGKGRLLLAAAGMHQFCRVTGVEFSPELCEVARENVVSYTRKTRLNTIISIVQSDATRYQLKPDDNVFYFFVPFDEVVMGRVLENVSQSLVLYPRKIWLILNWVPGSARAQALLALLDESDTVRRVMTFGYGSSTYYVYISHGF